MTLPLLPSHIGIALLSPVSSQQVKGNSPPCPGRFWRSLLHLSSLGLGLRFLRREETPLPPAAATLAWSSLSGKGHETLSLGMGCPPPGGVPFHVPFHGGNAGDELTRWRHAQAPFAFKELSCFWPGWSHLFFIINYY